MALNTLKCNYLTSLHFKGLITLLSRNVMQWSGRPTLDGGLTLALYTNHLQHYTAGHSSDNIEQKGPKETGSGVGGQNVIKKQMSTGSTRARRIYTSPPAE